jgi:nucleoid DNA-binding protein
MKIAYIFGAIFFILFIVDLFAAIATGSLDCQTTAICRVEEGSTFFSVTLYPLMIGTLVFIVAGRIFYSYAHKESDLLSVSDYKRAMDEEQQVNQEDSISREDLYERLDRKNVRKVNDKNVLQTIMQNISDFFVGIGDKLKESSAKRKEKANDKKIEIDTKKAEEAEMQRLEQEKLHQDQMQKAHRKLNKTQLIILIAETTHLTQTDARKFLNAFIESIKETVAVDEEVKIAKFGKFKKITIPEHIEVNEETKKSTTIDEYNTVEFAPFKNFLEMFGIETEDAIEESSEVKEEQPAEVVEEQPDEVIEEQPAEDR